MMDYIMDLYDSVYKKDYIKHGRMKKFNRIIDLETGTITEGKTFLRNAKEDDEPTIFVEPPDQLATEYLNDTFIKENKHLHRVYFETPLSYEHIEEYLRIPKRTVYGASYYKQVLSNEKKNLHVHLAEDAIIPQSEQRVQYREPASLFDISPPIRAAAPILQSDVNHQLQKSVKTAPRVTEYHRQYNRTGDLIINYEMLGKIKC